MPYDPSKKKKGIVAVIDALGVKRQDEHGVTALIESFDIFKQGIRANQDYIDDAITSGKFEHRDYATLVKAEFLTFNDSIIFCWESRNEDFKDIEDLKLLRSLSIVLKQTFKEGLKNNIKFRGAISYGDYYFDSDENLALGPAIADAAEYYETAQFIGIHLTPGFNSLVNELYFQLPTLFQRSFLLFFCPYKVPLKLKCERINLDLWCLNWPMKRSDEKVFDLVKPDEKFDFKEIFQNFAVPPVPTILEKYENTYAFYEYIKSKLGGDKNPDNFV